jgi:hypothetical protein
MPPFHPVGDVLYHHLIAWTSIILSNMVSTTNSPGAPRYHARVSLPEYVHTLGLELSDDRNGARTLFNHATLLEHQKLS